VLGPPGNEPVVTLLECLPRLRRAGFRHGRYCALPPVGADRRTDYERLGGRTCALVCQGPPRPPVAGDRGECLADSGQRVHVAADPGRAGGTDLGGLGGPLADAFGHGAGRLRSGAAGVGQEPFEAIERAPHVNPEALNGTNRMRLHVFANDVRGHVLLMAVYDNLGKGASGAAVQNLNLMIGAPETLGTDLPQAA